MKTLRKLQVTLIHVAMILGGLMLIAAGFYARKNRCRYLDGDSFCLLDVDHECLKPYAQENCRHYVTAQLILEEDAHKKADIGENEDA